MKNIKRIIALLLISVLAFSFAGCERTGNVSGYYEGSDYVEVGNDKTTSNDDSAKDDTATNKNDTTNKNDKNNTNTTSDKKTSTNKGVNRGEEMWQIKRDVKPGASSSIMKNLNFKGKTFKMLISQENFTDRDMSIIKAFGKKYNCTVKVEQVNFESILSVLATQMSAGKPYDIVHVHGAQFPQIAIANICQPLENYISKDDLTTKYGNQGLNWDLMCQSTTWGNHIYYTADMKSSYLGLMLYNKLLINDFGLEDPLTLYKNGKWTYDKIYEYGKIVQNANQGVYFYDSTVSPAGNANFYEITPSGKINWLGANTKYYNSFLENRKFQEASGLSGSSALVDNMVAGTTILQVIEAEKLVAFTNVLKGSSALGKNLNNLGVVPIPHGEDGKYNGRDTIGYAACRGVNPTAAIAFALYNSAQEPSWCGSKIPALENNKKLFTNLYNNRSVTATAYYFLSTDGKRIDQEIYNMKVEIANGGDIMKLLESYAPTVKSIVEYNLEKQ